MGYVEHVQNLARDVGGAVSTEQVPTRRVGRVFKRMGRCVLTYVLIHTAAWVAISLTVSWEETFLEIMTFGMGMLLIIGIPSVLIGVFAVTVHNRMDVVWFRMLLGIPLVLCAWPVIASSASEPMQFQVTAQVAFAVLIPAPLFPEDWLGEERLTGE
ncbi:hypothetical protein OG905_22500 [Streptomyces sp. NBC_00322]|uniref:hypothetical protein n=1 Tax=Streptomyces sp. NBC_00322 TaxID=2975712 RepID=UPI002E27CFA8|nr:hypothetical protein [Streptomyces sp. NBC_00322]